MVENYAVIMNNQVPSLKSSYIIADLACPGVFHPRLLTGDSVALIP